MFRLLSLSGALLALSAAGAAAGDCGADGIACDACNTGDKTGLNTMHSWPRYTSGGLAESDLSTYFECPSTDPGCDQADVPTVIDDEFAGNLPDSISDCQKGEFCEYVIGVASYGAIMLVLGFLVILCSGCFCWCRWCCCCCKGGTCGKRYPTREYSDGDRTCARVLIIIFSALVASFVAVGYTKGAAALSSAGYAVVDSPTGLMEAVQAADIPVGNFVANVGGGALVNFLININATITSAVDVKDVRNQMQCANDILEDVRELPGQVADELRGFDEAIDMLPSFGGAIDSLNDLNQSVYNLEQAVPALQTALVELNDSLVALSDTSELRSELLFLNTTITDLEAYPDEVTTTLDELDANLPTETEVGDLETSLTGLEAGGSRTTSQSLSTNQVYRDDLRTQLSDLKAQAEALPDTGALADSLLELNATLDDTTASVGTVADLVDDMDATLAALPAEADINGPLGVVQDEIDSFDASALSAVLVNMSAAIDALPGVDGLLAILDGIDRVADVIPCLEALEDDLERVNDTIIELPGDAGEIFDTIQDIKNTTYDALDEIDTLEGELVSMNDTLNDLPDIDGYVDDIDGIEGDLETIDADLDIAGLQADVSALSADADIDLAALSTSTRDLEATMADPATRPSQAMIDNLESFDESRQTLPGQIDALVAALDAWEAGSCTISGDPCVCDDLSACEDSPFTAASADCTGGTFDFCDMTNYASDGTYAAISAAVDEVAAEVATLEDSIANKPDDADIRSAMTDLESNLDGVPDIGEKLGELDELDASMEDVPDLGDYLSEMDNMDSTLDSIPDIGELRDQLQDLDEVINDDLPDLDDIIDDLDGLDEDFPDEDVMADALDDADKVVDIVYNQLGVWLANISTDALVETWEEESLTAMAKQIVFTVDNMRTYWDNEADTIYGDFDFDKLDQISGDAESLHGPVHFFAKLSEDDDAECSAEDAEDGAWKYFIVASGDGDRVEEDGDGNPYGPCEACVTSHCLHNEVDYALSADGMPVGMPATGLALAMYALPLLIVVMGVLSCTCRWGCCSLLMLFLIMAVMPWIFWVSVFEATPLIIGSDLCASGTTTGYYYLQFKEAEMCEDAFDGTYTSDAQCSVVVVEGDADDGSDDETAEFSLADVYADLFADCGGDGAIVDALDSLSLAVVDLPGDQINETIADSDDINIRDRLWGDINQLAAESGDSLATLVTDIGAVVGCDALGAGFTEIQDAMCCDVGDSLYWMAMSWVYIGLSMFVGCYAGIVGRKRFAKKTWGPVTKALKEAADADADESDFTVTFGGGAAPPPLSPYSIQRFTKSADTEGKGIEMHSQKATVSSI